MPGQLWAAPSQLWPFMFVLNRSMVAQVRPNLGDPGQSVPSLRRGLTFIRSVIRTIRMFSIRRVLLFMSIMIMCIARLVIRPNILL